MSRRAAIEIKPVAFVFIYIINQRAAAARNELRKYCDRAARRAPSCALGIRACIDGDVGEARLVVAGRREKLNSCSGR